MKVQDNSKGWPEGWLVAAAAAVLSAAMARVVGDLGLFAVVMIALFVFLVFGVLLGLFWGLPVTTSDAHHGHGHGSNHGHGPAAGHAAPHGSGSPVPAAHVSGLAAADHNEPPVAVATAGASLAIEPPAADMGSAGADTMTLPSSASVAAPEMAAAAPTEARAEPVVVSDPAKTVSEAPVAGTAEPASASASLLAGIAESPDTALVDSDRTAVAAAPADPIAQPDAAPVSETAAAAVQKPQGLSAAREGVPDRLQTIEGIGPALEKLCHDMGVYHFDQIASWGAAEVAWMDGNLKGFRGRVTRDRWVRQAALIGEVGIDEFLRRAKTNDY
jgi:predicted flap endonuclease-1-like 5' DNA nuclease